MTSLTDSYHTDEMTSAHPLKSHAPIGSDHVTSNPVYTSSGYPSTAAAFGGADGRGFMNYAAYPGALGMNGLPGSRYTAGALSYGIPFPGASILDSMKTSNGKSYYD